MSGQNDEVRTRFLAAVVERLSAARSTALNPECLSERALYRLFADIQSAGIRLPLLTKAEVRDWLQETGLLVPITLDETSDPSSRRMCFYSLGARHPEHEAPGPRQLLQAYHENGVLCYFTAIELHALSTQPPAHHHVAIPTPRRGPRVQTGTTTTKRTRKLPADPLGTWLFTFRGLRYYQTLRDETLMPGVQTRFDRSGSLIRITNLEQTLLDTLHRPLSCGGPSVVFEAWETAAGRFNEARLVRILEAQDHLAIVQRLGYILDRLAYQPGPELKKTLDNCLERLAPDDPRLARQLFPGIEYQDLNRPWLVYGP